MRILGIETSCDDSAAAVVDDDRILANVISSQGIHREYGGVVPEYASRAHMRLLLPVIRHALDLANLQTRDLEAIAVTYGPGLAGSILVGLNVAKSMALALNIPWVGVNHLEGHIFANFLGQAKPPVPFLCLIVSGGHTQLVIVEAEGRYRTIGRTIDDAAGEAFDKVARVLGLGYPGGPALAHLAESGNPHAIAFPRPMMEEGNLDFSFSGIKTAVLYYVQGLGEEEARRQLPDIAASFQAAVVDVLVRKTMAAAAKWHMRTICLAGGVAANTALREALETEAESQGCRLYVPPQELCTDNAAMIARAGLSHIERGERAADELRPEPALTLGFEEEATLSRHNPCTAP
ncbi:MAG: tRNA (adenosine(37)-N6)-threonylcarbamoyltransferase complex transferase subunit TsaD [candidate division KSB1 bacterium]|nr:tRNA (adenosine(37)-N6)-threonylcarbamoyltransferase complex transferase subunit TsaD [candidate division KSB1 bacterium]MDZ7294713.1 tRNA (adenosine(37)-N6)-threonylcarbamoyltransferase complex transferase subunit TsaD [candidate division KSB1 bacterium]MDZ7337978.1 tRNA (adenosine(37)-N6)-threonylcarbamoyltransferase complex transferase subunit TsaD [candidate division KSB1 bacterium]